MHTCILLCFSLRVIDTLKNFLNLVSPDGIDADASTICLSLRGVRRTKDDLSLVITLNSCFMAVIGFSFVGAVGVGKRRVS